MLGETLGSYRVTYKISEGGMGVVYAAEHTMLGRTAAVKVLHPELSSRRDMVERFFNEARATTAIRHPGIVEVFDFGFDAVGRAYIVMELLVGDSLAARARQGGIPVDVAVSIMRRVAQAVGAAHAKGIIHRDLKPDNVFLVADADVAFGLRPKVLDFGIAKLATSDPSQSKTRTGAVMGTPTYMSPEQCRGAGVVDHRADIYALGCILYELIGGRPPFVAEGFGEIIAAHMTTPPLPLGAFAPRVAPALEAVVMRCLAKSPDERFGSTAELVAALDTAIGHQGQALTPVPPPAHWSMHSVPPANTAVPTTLGGAAASQTVGVAPRAKWPWLVGAVVALGAAAAVAIAMGGGGASSKPSDSTAPAATAPTAPPSVAPPTTPATATPGTAAPGAATPGIATPGAVTPGAVTPGAVTPGAVTPGAVTPGAVTPGAVTPGTATPGTATTGTATPPVGAETVATPAPDRPEKPKPRRRPRREPTKPSGLETEL